MGRQFSGPRALSVFGRIKHKYARWGRWAQFVAIAVPVAALAGGGLAAAMHSGSGSGPAGASSAERISFPLAAVRVAAGPPAWRRGAGPGGIPAGVLGTWSGQIVLTKGLTESFVLSLARPGTAGSLAAVGTFRNQTAGCYGNVFLGGVSRGTRVELSLATTVDPVHACPASMEADVQLAKGGSALDYEIIGVDSVRATPQNPLAKGALYR
jgi:hypothetical protein